MERKEKEEKDGLKLRTVIVRIIGDSPLIMARWHFDEKWKTISWTK